MVSYKQQSLILKLCVITASVVLFLKMVHLTVWSNSYDDDIDNETDDHRRTIAQLSVDSIKIKRDEGGGVTTELNRTYSNVGGVTVNVDPVNSDVGGATASVQPFSSNVVGATANAQPVSSVVGGATANSQPVSSVVGGATANVQLVSSDVGGATANVQPVSSDVGGATANVQPVSSDAGGATANVQPVSSDVGGATANVQSVNSVVGGATTKIQPVSSAVGEATAYDLPVTSVAGGATANVQPVFSDVGGATANAQPVSSVVGAEVSNVQPVSSGTATASSPGPDPGNVGGAEVTLKPISSFARARLALRTKEQFVPMGKTNVEKNVKLILVSYMRGGGSFAGDIFNHHPKVFYVYEPMQAVEAQYVTKHLPVEYLDGNTVPYHVDMVPIITNNHMNHTINCKFDAMPVDFLKSKASQTSSLSFRQYSQCLKRKKSEIPRKADIRDCVPLLRRTCNPATVVVAKTSRVTMDMVRTYLTNDPKVKVIQLVRDPRAILQSMAKTGLLKKYPYTGKTLCKMLGKELEDARQLKELFPGRVMTARYEDLAQNPAEYSDRLLSFAGLELDPALGKYVQNITSAKLDRTSSVMLDSVGRASRWRDTIMFPYANIVYKVCRPVAEKLGYLPMSGKTSLKDHSRPYFTEDFSGLDFRLWKPY